MRSGIDSGTLSRQRHYLPLRADGREVVSLMPSASWSARRLGDKVGVLSGANRGSGGARSSMLPVTSEHRVGGSLQGGFRPPSTSRKLKGADSISQLPRRRRE